MRPRLLGLTAALLIPSIHAHGEDVLKIGMIGLDTSHAIEFTRILNDPAAPDHVPGARVVAGFPDGMADNPQSANRLEDYTRQLREKFGVEMVSDIPSLCRKVDAVLIESVDGRPHLEQVRPVIAARKPVFIDKPLAASLEDGREIARLARESGVPCFSSSSLRFFPGVAALARSPSVGDVLGCDSFGPSPTEPHHPDLYWYGIHGVEILFTILGPGCESVTRVAAPDQDVVVGRWKGGRIGTFRGIRKGAAPYGATVFGTKGKEASPPVTGSIYRPLLEEIVKFFRTGVAPVPLEVTVEMLAFMSAADESKRLGGAPVALAASAGEVEPRPGQAGRKVKIGSGEIQVLELIRFLADFTGLPAVVAPGGTSLSDRMVLIPAPIEGADDAIVKKYLEASRVRVTESTTGAGRRVLLIEAMDAPPPDEPVQRPIVVVGGEQAGRPASRPSPAGRPRGAPGDGAAREAGLVLTEVPDAVRAQLDLDEGSGVLVLEVDAARVRERPDLAALKLHDVITHVDTALIRSPGGFTEAINRVDPGKDYELRVIRKGVTKILQVRKGR